MMSKNENVLDDVLAECKKKFGILVSVSVVLILIATNFSLSLDRYLEQSKGLTTRTEEKKALANKIKENSDKLKTLSSGKNYKTTKLAGLKRDVSILNAVIKKVIDKKSGDINTFEFNSKSNYLLWIKEVGEKLDVEYHKIKKYSGKKTSLKNIIENVITKLPELDDRSIEIVSNINKFNFNGDDSSLFRSYIDIYLRIKDAKNNLDTKIKEFKATIKKENKEIAIQRLKSQQNIDEGKLKTLKDEIKELGMAEESTKKGLLSSYNISGISLSPMSIFPMTPIILLVLMLWLVFYFERALTLIKGDGVSDINNHDNNNHNWFVLYREPVSVVFTYITFAIPPLILFSLYIISIYQIEDLVEILKLSFTSYTLESNAYYYLIWIGIVALSLLSIRLLRIRYIILKNGKINQVD